MHYMAVPVSFRWDEDFVRRIDAARGDVPRSVFVRRAVEAVIGVPVLTLPEGASEEAVAAVRRELPGARVERSTAKPPKRVRAKPAPSRPIVQKRAKGW